MQSVPHQSVSMGNRLGSTGIVRKHTVASPVITRPQCVLHCHQPQTPCHHPSSTQNECNQSPTSRCQWETDWDPPESSANTRWRHLSSPGRSVCSTVINRKPLVITRHQPKMNAISPPPVGVNGKQIGIHRNRPQTHGGVTCHHPAAVCAPLSSTANPLSSPVINPK